LPNNFTFTEKGHTSKWTQGAGEKTHLVLQQDMKDMGGAFRDSQMQHSAVFDGNLVLQKQLGKGLHSLRPQSIRMLLV
jgi:hypothetical protein